MNLFHRILLLSLLCFGSSGYAWSQEVPFIYHRAGGDESAGVEVETETAYGTREARPFGEQGIEQGIRVSARFSRWIELEAWGGLLWDQGNLEASGASGEIRSHLLTQDGNGIGLSVGLGMIRDFRGDAIGRSRLTLSRSLGNLELAGTTIVEVPFASDRDAVDLVMGVGSTYKVTPWMNAGAEVLGEDLEGFWEEDEAEGGARLIAGPTVDVTIHDRLHVKANAGFIYAMTTSEVNAPADPQPGFLGRMAVGWSW
jgi:hypothetical protein